MQRYIFPTSASFVSGVIFRIPIFIRPWEREPGRQKGKHLNVCFFSVSSCDLPSLRWDLGSNLNVCLPLSFFPLFACSPKSQTICSSHIVQQTREVLSEWKEEREAAKWQITRTESKQATDADTEEEETEIQRYRKKYLYANRIN